MSQQEVLNRILESSEYNFGNIMLERALNMDDYKVIKYIISYPGFKYVMNDDLLARCVLWCLKKDKITYLTLILDSGNVDYTYDKGAIYDEIIKYDIHAIISNKSTEYLDSIHTEFIFEIFAEHGDFNIREYDDRLLRSAMYGGCTELIKKLLPRYTHFNTLFIISIISSCNYDADIKACFVKNIPKCVVLDRTDMTFSALVIEAVKLGKDIYGPLFTLDDMVSENIFTRIQPIIQLDNNPENINNVSLENYLSIMADKALSEDVLKYLNDTILRECVQHRYANVSIIAEFLETALRPQ